MLYAGSRSTTGPSRALAFKPWPRRGLAARQRGPDPLGYRTLRDDKGRVGQPRTLEMVTHEADAIRRLFLLGDIPLSAVAAALNRHTGRPA